VETDLRRPTLAQDFGFQQVPGLTDCLADDLPIQDSFRGTDLDNLYVVPGGTPTNHSSRLLRSGALVAAIAEMRQFFDLVIMDVPALLASSDASLLTDLADGAVLVVRAGVTPVKSVERAIRQVDDAKMRGTILNAAESSLPNWLRRIGGI
jgi:Mrp family chromosome partitioning ATPase